MNVSIDSFKGVLELDMNAKVERLLRLVERPARYAGGELGAVIKDAAKVDVRFCMCFPDVYEVGMSHLGSKILYALINAREDAWCERAFAPWVDMDEAMRSHRVPLFSLESRTPLSAFDIVGFTLQYEMSYTNILNMLELSGIPLRAENRAEGMPIVACGGPCACNPEPLAPFVDLFMIGDGEEVMNEVLDCYAACKREGKGREHFLREAAQIDGVYVPRFYHPVYNEDGTFDHMEVEPGFPKKIRRRIVKDLENTFNLTQMVVPYMGIVHDRIMLELFRGCTRGCRFCQAGFLYRPVRERSVDKLKQLARALVDNTGYEEMSLSSLSSGDYPCLSELIEELVNMFKNEKVALSLPSLRIDSFAKKYADELSVGKKTSLTFAPEAGTQRLRDVINKGVTEEDLIRSVTDAFASGYNAVKLYFMIGLPTETNEDLDGIADLAAKVRAAYFSVPKEKRARGLRITVSASSFVPKPCAPFQYVPQCTVEEFREKQRYLREKLKEVKGVEFNYHDPELSSLEAAFARGDRKLADVLERAFRKGCRFDSWSDCFDYGRWLSAFEEAGVDLGFYAYRQRPLDEKWPWGHIDTRVREEYLQNEYKKALCAARTKDCRQGCNGCFDRESYANYCGV